MLAVEILGADFVAYCLNLPREEVEIARTLSVPLSPGAVELDDIAKRIRESDPGDRNRQYSRLLRCGAGEPNRANQIRDAHGGEAFDDLLNLDVYDSATRTLYRVCVDLIAAAYLESRHTSQFGWTWEVLTGPVMNHPEFWDLVEALTSSKYLIGLFPEPHSTGRDLHGSAIHHWASGAGGTAQVPIVVVDIVSKVFFDLPDRPTAAIVLECARNNLVQIGELASGKLTEVRALVALANIDMSDSLIPLDFVGGEFREPRRADRAIFSELPGTSTILEITAPERLLRVDSNAVSDTDHNDTFASARNKFEKEYDKFDSVVRNRSDIARFSLLLASSPRVLAAPLVLGTKILSPFTLRVNPKPGPFIQARIITGNASVTPEVRDRFALWTRLLEKHPANLDMAVRRLLSAASSRPDPVDGFVDAIISWENMFGTSQGETSFRITAAMSRLMCSDPQQRKALFDELKQLYGIRSKLIHGAKEPDSRTADRHRARAIRLGIDAMQRIYANSELCQAGSSGERGRLLLLGA